MLQWWHLRHSGVTQPLPVYQRLQRTSVRVSCSRLTKTSSLHPHANVYRTCCKMRHSDEWKIFESQSRVVLIQLYSQATIERSRRYIFVCIDLMRRTHWWIRRWPNWTFVILLNLPHHAFSNVRYATNYLHQCAYTFTNHENKCKWNCMTTVGYLCRRVCTNNYASVQWTQTMYTTIWTLKSSRYRRLSTLIL